ncbi:MAG: chromosome segregation protein SMC [Syntrophales bacterium]|jgi:chromosome segregation protein|nr:chromosome segregation protein SMC [Syntrophales bacterium]MCK9390563.1 chromosome segregation protein SMC [Syntrophales bacterium]
MKLKYLEISGFKSFRDKVVLDFAAGVSAVVGPNGCGKSNVVDAIRWVMGEQRIKSLRGVKMEDVIFNGSQEAAPVGMAEISMILAADGVTFPDPYAAYSELTVTRRLFRDGESEYAVNGVTCRLLDVREFFLGTGVGARTYSIIEQNSVASLVEAKPEERRQFIEEAAGISKYKTRKESALRKLEATKQNILRLNDILREVKSQLNAVSRQAKRAEQYKDLKTAIREDEIAAAFYAYIELCEKHTNLTQQREAWERQESELKASLASCETLLAAAKLEVVTQESDRSQYQEKIYQLRTNIQVKEKGVEFSKGRIADINARKKRLGEEVRQLKARHEELLRELERITALQQVLDADIAQAQDHTKDGECKVSEIKRELSSRQQHLEENKVQLIDIAAEKSRLNNNYGHLVRVLDDLGRKKERNNKDIGDHRQGVLRLEDRLKELAASLNEDLERLGQLRSSKATAAEEWENARTELQEVEGIIDSLKEDLSSRSSRFTSLKELHDGYVWCNEATRSIMMAKETKGLQGVAKDQVIGLVAEQIRVPQAYETAVEAVLGDKLQYVVVRSHEAGVQAIDYLKEAAVGRSSFVPLQVRHAAQLTVNAAHLRESERLIDRIEVAESFRGIAEYLLGDVLLIPNLRNGLELWNRNGFRGTFVTPDGDMISPQGVLTGGRNGKGDRSLLKNKREMEALEVGIRDLSTVLQEEGIRKKCLASLAARGEEELDSLTSDIHAAELQCNSHKKDVERYQEELKRIQQTLKILEFNSENLDEEEQQAREKLKNGQEDLEGQKKREVAIQETVAVLQEKARQLRRELEDRDRELTAVKVRQASLAEKQKSALSSSERINTEIDILTEKIREGKEDSLTSNSQVEELQGVIDREELQLVDLYKSFTEMERLLAEKKDLYALAETSLKEWESKSREAKEKSDQIIKQGRDLETVTREISYQMDSLSGMIAEKHGTVLQEQARAVQQLNDEDLKIMQERLAKNRQLLDAFGEVNLLAISEYDQLKERFDFLTSQARDLDASVQTLEQTIAKINRVSRQRFAETFEAVRGCFREVFSRIFPGGKGELHLTDESDLLETGVDIDIQIPGKRPQNISLLSGGEKSLAAIALILAIIMYRPTPFLVLDEVDAALDDANVALFAKIIKEIAANSQVILITHNKRTMEVAENLFGVTMQKQGISAVVSVSLN